jgi:purine-binding chemotaxis protein CheW
VAACVLDVFFQQGDSCSDVIRFCQNQNPPTPFLKGDKAFAPFADGAFPSGRGVGGILSRAGVFFAKDKNPPTPPALEVFHQCSKSIKTGFQENLMEKQLVIFELAEEHFGIDISMVEGIIKMQQITRVPQSPDYVEGITNLRGAVLPVIDLEKRFGIIAHEQTRDTRIVVVNLDKLKIGMIVGAVSEVLTIDDSVIEPAPAIVTTINSRFISGIARIDSRLVILLDLSLVLSEGEITQIARISV